MTLAQPVFTEHFIPAEDGLMLYARDYNSADLSAAGLPTVVCLAGLSRNSRDFHRFAVSLSSNGPHARRVVAIDYRGRGLSERDPDSSHYQLPVEAADVAHICAALGIGKADFIGTSRGGLILHLLAASNPTLLNRVVLNDIGPVIELTGLLNIRDYLSSHRQFDDWEDISLYLAHLHGAAFPALSRQDWDEMAQALYRRQGDAIVADFDPALVNGFKDLTLETQLADLWALFEGLKPFPLLILRGENSGLLTMETALEMAHRHPDATLLEVEGQGHAPLLHFSGPRQAIERFLAKQT
jgi:pimeloyl-ACP methyl ester carboxylesterase